MCVWKVGDNWIMFVRGTQTLSRYAFGITMWELFSGGRPFKDIMQAFLAHQVSLPSAIYTNLFI